MSHYYVFVDQFDCVVVTWTGRFSAAQFAAFLDEMGRDPEYDRGWRVLHDLRLAVVDLSSADLRNMRDAAERARRLYGVFDTVFLVDGDLAYGLMRQFSSIAGGSNLELRVSRKVAEARAWAGLPPGYVPPTDTVSDPAAVAHFRTPA